MREVERSATYLLNRPVKLERALSDVTNKRENAICLRNDIVRLFQSVSEAPREHRRQQILQEKLRELREEIDDLTTGREVQQYISGKQWEAPTLRTIRLDQWLEDTGLCELVAELPEHKQIETMMEEKHRIIRACVAWPFVSTLKKRGDYRKLFHLAEEGYQWDGPMESDLTKLAARNITLSLGYLMQIEREHGKRRGDCQ